MESILKGKTELVGSWTSVNGQMVDDATSQTIKSLIKNHLQKLAVTMDGWETLYRDPSDHRLWELTYPHSEMHGGGPQALRVLSFYAATSKYGPFQL